jgi:alkanesulfonate monooxygenase SsuD/methylene tetrahydromethanopterin reductase-like flavin-dependent oxidoreductase (luciferase family)
MVYRESSRKAEAAKFDLVFIVDSPFITPDTAAALSSTGSSR